MPFLPFLAAFLSLSLNRHLSQSLFPPFSPTLTLSFPLSSLLSLSLSYISLNIFSLSLNICSTLSLLFSILFFPCFPKPSYFSYCVFLSSISPSHKPIYNPLHKIAFLTLDAFILYSKARNPTYTISQTSSFLCIYTLFPDSKRLLFCWMERKIASREWEVGRVPRRRVEEFTISIVFIFTRVWTLNIFWVIWEKCWSIEEIFVSECSWWIWFRDEI